MLHITRPKSRHAYRYRVVSLHKSLSKALTFLTTLYKKF